MKTIAEVVKSARQVAAVQAFKAVNVDNQGVIIAIGASVGLDREDDAVTRGALVGMAYDFCASSNREFRANHDADAILKADLVASFPGAPILKSGALLAPGSEIPDDDEIIGIDIRKGNETHWFVGIKPHDPAITEAARKGELAGLSWGGYARKEDAHG